MKHLLNRHLLSKYPIINNKLHIDNIPYIDLIKKFGTPVYIYSADIIRNQIYSLKENFKSFQFLYSIKANPNLSICHLIRNLDVGAELASGGELDIAIKADFNLNRTVFAGPGKNYIDIEKAINNNILSINVESISELNLVNDIAKKLDRVAQVSLRINYKSKDKISVAEVMSGIPSKFGIEEDQATEIDLSLFPFLDIVGIHTYTASELLDIEIIAQNFRNTLDLALRLSRGLGFKLKLVDFGGGFGIPNNSQENYINLKKLGTIFEDILKYYKNNIELLHTDFFIELGRFIVSESGVYFSKIIDNKKSKGFNFSVIDGGMHHFFRPVFMKTQHPTFIVNKIGLNESSKVNIEGCLCTPIDTVCKNLLTPDLDNGDIVGIFNAGAYGYSMSMLEFLSHSTPKEILVINGEVYLIRESRGIDDILNTQTNSMIHWLNFK